MTSIISKKDAILCLSHTAIAYHAAKIIQISPKITVAYTLITYAINFFLSAYNNHYSESDTDCPLKKFKIKVLKSTHYAVVSIAPMAIVYSCWGISLQMAILLLGLTSLVGRILNIPETAYDSWPSCLNITQERK